MKKFHRAKPVDKVEQAVQALHEYIIDGGLEPGTPLPSESEMVEQIGVSKFSMREALRVAQSQGLVEIAQGKRTKVADVSVKPAAGVMNLLLRRSKNLLLELTEARRSLEMSMVRLAAQRRSDEQLQAMIKTIEDMEANKDDLAYCVERDYDFHEIMAQATENRVFQLIHQSISELLRESRQETISMGGTGLPIAEHQRIVDAIRDQDVQAATEAMSAHLDTAEMSIRNLEEE